MASELGPLIEAITKLTVQVAEGQKELVKEVRLLSEAFSKQNLKFDPEKLRASTKDIQPGINLRQVADNERQPLQDPLKSFPEEMHKLDRLNAGVVKR